MRSFSCELCRQPAGIIPPFLSNPSVRLCYIAEGNIPSLGLSGRHWASMGWPFGTRGEISGAPDGLWLRCCRPRLAKWLFHDSHT